MMKKQTHEWLSGYLFSETEGKVLKHWKDIDKEDCIVVESQIPLLWFGTNYRTHTDHMLTLEKSIELSKKLDTTLRDVFTTEQINTVANIHKQYMIFTTTVAKVKNVRKLTVDQIEELLGYKIEIISN